ncbi:MAG: DUF3656 domain-containing protein, partial [Candidatus Binatia bacterium]
VFAASLGVTRVVVPRELSVDEIRRFAEGATVELEVFIHGALCVAWSGQCLTSEAWGGRSANRGQCAQSCRMPYDLVLDGEVRALGDVAYLLSPKDLAGLRAVADLAALGVHGLKIEGRQKGAAYVATATAMYRHWVDAVASERGPSAADEASVRDDLLRTSLVYTRGFSDGFLGGSDHQTLVEGRFPKHRGAFLGRVTRVGRDTVQVGRDPAGRPWTGARASDDTVSAPLGAPAAALRGFGGARDASDGPRAAALEPRAGMGVVFDAGHPEDPREPGGPIFAVEPTADGWALRFGQPGPDLGHVTTGDRVWITSDPAIGRETERVLAADEPTGRIALELTVHGAAGEPLRVVAVAGHARAEITSPSRLQPAAGGGLTETVLREKLASVGGTPFRVATIDCGALADGLHLPVSELKTMRRALVATLLPQVEHGSVREVHPDSFVSGLCAGARVLRPSRWTPPAAPELVVLCRRAEQLEAVIASGAGAVELDWMELVGLGKAVARARAAGLQVTLATVRVQKPGEEGYDRRLAALAPDAVLVRHWGALTSFQRVEPPAAQPRDSRDAQPGDSRNAQPGDSRDAQPADPRNPQPGDSEPTQPGAAKAARPLLHGDFSLNVTNSITAAELFDRGLDTLTASHDLDRAQLLALLDQAPAERFTVVLHHRIATFHTEHCVYAHVLSTGRDFRTCGRPCEQHELGLRDHKGRTHPVIVDVGCRNTVFNSEVQSAADLVPELVRRGVRRFRVELVRETRAETARVLAAYADLLAGKLSPAEAMARAEARAHYGVSHAPMALMS